MYALIVLDVETLRLLVGIVSLVVLALFYLGVYRPTHSPFSGWWTISLSCAAVSSMLLLGNGSSLMWIANPVSSAVAVVGALCVWFATRSLRQKRSPVWLLAAAPATVLVAAYVDQPRTNDWAGNGLLFVMVAAAFIAGAVEVWGTWVQRRSDPDRPDSGEAINALLVCAIAATMLAALYAERAVLFIAVGHEDPVFKLLADSSVAAITLLVCLVAVTFSVSALGWDQRTRELRRRASEDDLTGLLGRTAFLARAQGALSQAGGRRARRAWLVIADLDHFKPINDEFGHQAGDLTLQTFAEVARGALRSSDAVGRLGGDEFGIVLENIDEDMVLSRLDTIRERLAAGADGAGHDLPTVSFGVAECEAGLSLSEVMGRADAALYDAKGAGRDRAAVYVAD